MTKPVLVSGIQPSGPLHVGNYLGALRNFVELQNSGKYECFFFIADLHALTEWNSRKELQKNISDLATSYIQAGLNPKKSTLFIQSEIPSHAELGWIFNTITPMGELERMTQFKDKTSRGISANVGLFSYPTLMAADILIYKARVVPVGDDQDQHLELTRTAARQFNKTFGSLFPEPKALHTKTPRVMSLRDPSAKMSKSAPKGCLFLADSPKEIKTKISRAITDSENTIEFDPKNRPGVSNLVLIYAEFAGASPTAIVKKYKGKGYADFKRDLADLLIKKLEPFRAKAKTPSFAKGNKKAAKLAEAALQEAKQKTGLL